MCRCPWRQLRSQIDRPSARVCVCACVRGARKGRMVGSHERLLVQRRRWAYPVQPGLRRVDPLAFPPSVRSTRHTLPELQWKKSVRLLGGLGHLLRTQKRRWSKQATINRDRQQPPNLLQQGDGELVTHLGLAMRLLHFQKLHLRQSPAGKTRSSYHGPSYTSAGAREGGVDQCTHLGVPRPASHQRLSCD
jgi:hypothetical protein